MGKFFGMIGFSDTEETSPGVWKEKIIEKPYYGDIIQNTRRWEKGVDVNDDIVVLNRISVISDDYIRTNIGRAKYVIFEGFKWKIGSIDISYPRITLNLSGVYNDD